jgi:bidirectional [NiFe] hydrogenase diaphorase subunit
MGTACYVKGAGKIVATLEDKLGIKIGETSADGQVSLLSARCVGACGIAPVMVLDNVVSGKQDSETAWEKIAQLEGK